MSDWIKDEVSRVQRLDAEEQRKERRRELIERQASGLWQMLSGQVQEDVDTINATPELVDRLKCKLTYQELNTSSFKVIKETYPAVYLTASNGYSFIQIERKVVTNGESRKKQEEKERFDFDLDANDRIFIKTANGHPMQLEEVSRYLLKPLLNY